MKRMSSLSNGQLRHQTINDVDFLGPADGKMPNVSNATFPCLCTRLLKFCPISCVIEFDSPPTSLNCFLWVGMRRRQEAMASWPKVKLLFKLMAIPASWMKSAVTWCIFLVWSIRTALVRALVHRERSSAYALGCEYVRNGCSVQSKLWLDWSKKS